MRTVNRQTTLGIRVFAVQLLPNRHTSPYVESTLNRRCFNVVCTLNECLRIVEFIVEVILNRWTFSHDFHFDNTECDTLQGFNAVSKVYMTSDLYHRMTVILTGLVIIHLLQIILLMNLMRL